MSKWRHIPILAPEIKELLITNTDGVYLDATLGLGGHAAALLGGLSQNARLIGLDKDPCAVKMAVENVNDGRLRAFAASYLQAPEILKKLNISGVEGALFDLGLSSYQLDDASRGFSFMNDGPLDMRFDNTKGQSAADIINTSPPEEIARILEKYGEERLADKIAVAIYRAAKEQEITSTSRLAGIVQSVAPRKGRLHPATKTFQALRIAVNDEIKNVESLSALISEILKPAARAAFLTFHSAEDRIIKRGLKLLCENGGWRLVNKKVIAPSYAEVKNNPRARSAKLRVIERLK